jgi:hypothetical protein
MDAYHIALFLHLITLIVAASATAVTKLAVGRRIRARTVAEALDWHEVLVSTSKLFPICLASFLLTGAYMVSILGTRAWSSGFTIAGLVAVTLLLGSGTFLGVKAKGLKQFLQTVASKDAGAPPPRLVPPPLVTMLPLINTGIAIAVVFDMTTKPASVPVALGMIALGVIAGAAPALLRRRAAKVVVGRELRIRGGEFGVQS